MFTPKAIFFDLDGTLLHSLPDLAWAADQMMLAMNRAAPGIELVGRWIGNGAERLIKRALTGSMEGEPPEAELCQGKRLFQHFYEQSLATRSKPYEGVVETLERLRDRQTPLACITNKPAAFTAPLLDKLGLTHYFSLCLSGDSLANKKPHPEPLLYAADHCGMALPECLMVGDSKNDIAAARAAGCPVIAVSYGYNHGENIHQAGPDAVIDRFDELLRFIQ